MTDAFAELGLTSAIADAVRAAGYTTPTPLQAAAASVVRRGTNVVLNASAGAGVTAAFGLPLLDRLAADDAAAADGDAAGLRALVLVPTADRAEHVARGLATLTGDTGIAVRAIGTGWRAAGSAVLVTTAQRALEGVQVSELKLDGLLALVVMDAAEMFALGGGAALETLVPLVPRDAQRIITSATLTPDVQRFIEAHARKALTLPARPAAPPRTQQAPEPLGQIGYMIVDESAKAETLARLLVSVTEPVTVFTRTALRADDVMRELTRRGIAGDDRDIRAVAFDAGAPDTARTISHDVPFSAEQLRSIHAKGGSVLITPAERAHLNRIADGAQFTLKHRGTRDAETGALDAFRRSIRTALEAEDLDAQLLILEPLLAEHDASEIAAALSALLRRRAPAPSVAAPAAIAGAPPAEASVGGFTRLFVSIGARDDIRPGDLVGAITGEANIKGDQVGRVDIRDAFSVVEVASSVAERVIRALNGTTMRGRSLRVDFDRKGAAAGGAGRDRAPRGPRGPGSSGDRPRPRTGRAPGVAPRRRPPEG